jgi:hypothetical protein
LTKKDYIVRTVKHANHMSFYMCILSTISSMILCAVLLTLTGSSDVILFSILMLLAMIGSVIAINIHYNRTIICPDCKSLLGESALCFNKDSKLHLGVWEMKWDHDIYNDVVSNCPKCGASFAEQLKP